MLAEYLAELGIKDKESKACLWDGPESNTPNGGVTYSLLNRFLSCRERFRVLVVLGLRCESWNHRLFYGNCWHLCEELHCQGKDWYEPLYKYAQKECLAYPYSQNEIEKWYNVCNVQFPHYVEYWSKHPDSMSRTSLMSEVSFNVPYKLDSGRIVRLRGKWDRVDLLDNGVWLYDHKTKSQIVQHQLMKQLTFDMQVMLYMSALVSSKEYHDKERVGIVNWSRLEDSYKHKIMGCVYNVVRRPLSGGAGTIVRWKASKHKPAETKEHYYQRLSDIIRDDPESYFIRWQIPISQNDIKRFQQRCLNPILENLCLWWDWIKAELNDPWTDPNPGGSNSVHWITPYGLYDPLKDGGTSDLDNAVMTGSTVGLTQVDNLFPELS